MKRIFASVSALVLVLALGVTTAQAVPGDPCDASFTPPMNSTAKLKAYIDCRADRQDAAIAALATPAPTVTAFVPVPVPGPTVTVTATPSPAASATATVEPTEPAPSPTVPGAPDLSSWPSEATTGVPDGIVLTPYPGPLTITEDGAVISGQLVTGTLTVQASGVTIVNSRIIGGVRLTSPKLNDHSFTIVDSEVHWPSLTGTGIMNGNFRATRVEVTGGNRSMYCEYNCVVEDSLVHKQGADVGGDAHFSGIRQEQNGVFRHNTLICEAARGPDTGCSAALTGYGDFAPVQNNLIDNNLFIGNRGGGASMCAYGGSSGAEGGKPYGHLARDIRFVNNVFVKGSSGKCGNIGTVAHFDLSLPGNVWAGNVWADGTLITNDQIR